MQCLREGRRFTCEDHDRVVTRSKNGAEGGDADDAQRGVASSGRPEERSQLEECKDDVKRRGTDVTGHH